jgi:hypothetical protein
VDNAPADQTIPGARAAGATAGTAAAPGEHPEPADRQRVKHGGALRTAVVVNPARVEGLDELRATIEETLAGAGWPAPLWFETTPEDPGAGQARRAVGEGAEVVFVSGGDGTVRSCVEGLAGTEAALAVLPAGTGNLLAANLGLGLLVALAYAAKRARRGQHRGLTLVTMAVGIAATLQSLAFAINPMGGLERGDDLSSDIGVWVGLIGAAIWAVGAAMLAKEIEGDDDERTDNYTRDSASDRTS